MTLDDATRDWLKALYTVAGEFSGNISQSRREARQKVNGVRAALELPPLLSEDWEDEDDITGR